MITAAVNEAEGGLGGRTVDEVKKKWKDLLQAARRDSSLLKPPPPTGGGPPPKISPYSTIIMDVFGDDSPAFNGLKGCDTSASYTGHMEEKQVEVQEDSSFSSSSSATSSATSHEGNITS